MEITPLIDQIYDCVDDAEQWPAVLQSLFDEFQCSTASFQSYSFLTKELVFSSPLGFDQSWIDQYQRDWHSQNPLPDAVMDYVFARPQNKRDTVCTIKDCLGFGVYHRTTIYQEFFRPTDQVDIIQLPVRVKSDPMAIGLTSGRQQGQFAETQLNAANLLSSHLVRAGDISDKLRYAKAFAAAENLKMFSEPAFIIDQHGRPLDLNDAAKSLLDEDSIFISNGSRLAFKDIEADRKLQQHIHGLNKCFDATGGMQRVTDLVITPYISALFYTLPLCSFNRLATPTRREYLMCVCQQVKMSDTVIQGLTERFALTKTETAIAALMLEGLSVSDISQRRKTKISTTRWHVRRLFEKLSVSNQRELIRKILLQ